MARPQLSRSHSKRCPVAEPLAMAAWTAQRWLRQPSSLNQVLASGARGWRCANRVCVAYYMQGRAWGRYHRHKRSGFRRHSSRNLQSNQCRRKAAASSPHCRRASAPGAPRRTALGCGSRRPRAAAEPSPLLQWWLSSSS